MQNISSTKAESKDEANKKLSSIHIETALKNGGHMHSFRSGGGLRVVRIEKNDKLLAYGEHPNIEEALEHANEDYKHGHRDYKTVYGRQHPHYLTGSSQISSSLDQWLLCGHTFDSWFGNNQFVFQLTGIKQVEIPQEIKNKVDADYNKHQFTFRDIVYEVGPANLGPNSYSIKVLSNPKNKDTSYYYISKTGYGDDFLTALTNALKAEEFETSKK